MQRTLPMSVRGVLTALVLTSAPLSGQLASCSDGARTRQCQIPPISMTLIPSDSVGGDMEFAGHPVDVSLLASRRLNSDSTSVVVDLGMRAVEVVKDSTWIAGADSIVLFTAQDGWKIEALPGLPLTVSDAVDLIVEGKTEVVVDPRGVADDRTENNGMCLRHAVDVCRNTSNDGVVARWIVWGDSGSRDLGHTRVFVQLASLSLNVTKIQRSVVSDPEPQ